MECMDIGVISLIPVVLTIALAVKTKNVLVSLFIGVFSGVMFSVGYNPVTAIKVMLKDYVLATMLDSYNAGVIMLLVFIGGFVTLIEQSGGAEAFAESASKFVNTRCKTQLAAWIAGVFVFFSELGTPLIVGPVFTPIFKKMRISREKLAWILDTTASPVCVLIPFIGWGVYSMGLIQAEFDALNITHITDWSAFINAIPFQFYSILSLVMVPIVIFSKSEFGSMADCEKKAEQGVFSIAVESDVVTKEPKTGSRKVSSLVVILPLIVLFITLFGMLAPQGFPMKKVPGGDFRIALISGYLFASLAMILLMKYYGVDTVKGGVKTYIRGTRKLFDCILMLVLAWALSSVGKTLGTADYIVGLAEGIIPAMFVPAIIFLVSSVMSFATGTSWGTFAIVMPIAIPMAVVLDAPLFVTIAAVLSGGLFGDHCSPISDTTILAATGSGCGLIEHVETQLPYVMICAGVSFVAYIVAGAFPTFVVTVLSLVALIILHKILSVWRGASIDNLTSAEIAQLDK